MVLRENNCGENHRKFIRFLSDHITRITVTKYQYKISIDIAPYSISSFHFILCWKFVLSHPFRSFCNYILYHLFILCCKYIYQIKSHHIISYHIKTYHFISYHFISYYIISYHFISYYIISYHIISYHFISYDMIWYYIISYRTSYCYVK